MGPGIGQPYHNRNNNFNNRPAASALPSGLQGPGMMMNGGPGGIMQGAAPPGFMPPGSAFAPPPGFVAAPPPGFIAHPPGYIPPPQ